MRLELLVRDALCAAAARARNAQDDGADRPEAVRDDMAQIATLLRQATMALPAAVQRGGVATVLGEALAGDLRHGRALVSADTLGDLTAALTTACARFPWRKARSPWRRTASHRRLSIPTPGRGTTGTRKEHEVSG